MASSLRPSLEGPTDEELDFLHDRSLDLLRRPGVRFCAPALELLAGHGCAVDEKQGMARIPAAVVERALSSVPRTVRLVGLEPGLDLALDGERPHWALGSPLGPAPGADVLRLAGALREVEVIHAGGDGDPLGRVAACWQLTGKHARVWLTRPVQVPWLLRLAAAVQPEAKGQGSSLSAVEWSPTPLARDEDSTRASLALAAQGVPILIYTTPAPGPGESLAEAVAPANAGFLAALVLLQCARPGAALIYGLGPKVDPGGEPFDAAAGLALLLAAGLARRYGVPLSADGLSAAAPGLGPRAGWEGMSGAALAVLAGCDEVHGLGLLDGGRALSTAKMVHDAEQVRQLIRLARGVHIDDEHLHAEVIGRVGPHGHYLLERETRRLMRASVTPRQVRDERSPAEWLAGGRDEEARLAEEADRLEAQPGPAAWSAERAAAIDAVLAEARAALGGQGGPA